MNTNPPIHPSIHPIIHPSTHPSARRRGTALIVVMWSLFALVAMALAFGHGQAVAYRETDARIAAAQARMAIDGAAAYLETALATPEAPGRLPARGAVEVEDVPVGDARFWILGRADTGLASDRPVFGLVDEASRINLNTATRTMLEALPGMTPELAAAVLEWRTPGLAADATAYLFRDPPYLAKGAPFESVEELMLVEGFDLELLFGADRNRNGAVDSWESGMPPPALADLLTVVSYERNAQADGSARVNLNAQAPMLVAALAEPLGEARAQAVVQALRADPAPLESVLEAFHRGGFTADEFTRVEDLLTVSDEPLVRGRVNVHTASGIALAVLPGLDTDLASRLVAARSADGPPTLAWAAEVLGPEASRRAGPHLTARSFQVSADIVATGREGRGYQRRRIIFDTATGTPRRIYHQDLTALGWALGERPGSVQGSGFRVQGAARGQESGVRSQGFRGGGRLAAGLHRFPHRISAGSPPRSPLSVTADRAWNEPAGWKRSHGSTSLHPGTGLAPSSRPAGTARYGPPRSTFDIGHSAVLRFPRREPAFLLTSYIVNRQFLVLIRP